MKRLALALLLLLSAAPAWAVDAIAYKPTRKSSRYERVAFIRPSRHDVLGGNLAGIRQEYRNALGNTYEALRDRGIEVHEYDTAVFEGSAAARDLWENFGSRYAVAVIVYPNTSVASFARYICADSTNTQLIVIGDRGGSNTWAAGDTAVRGFVDTKPGFYEAVCANNRAFVTNSRQDTMWALRIASGRRRSALQSGQASVIRLTQPKTLTGTTFIQDADSVNSFMPGFLPGGLTGNADSVAGSNQYLGPMWKVVYDKNLEQVIDAQGAIDASLLYHNTLDSALCPREVYFVKFVAGVFPLRAYPQLLWSLLCRFTYAKPLQWAYDVDDITDKFGDNQGLPERWTNATAHRLMRDTLNFYGVTWSAQINPDHAASYLRGENPRYESAWSGDPHHYLRGKTWVHHAHDSTHGHISSNMVGASGGYSSGNGGSVVADGSTILILSHRYAFRDSTAMDAGAGAGPFRDAAGNYFGAGNRWGIWNRLAWSDSVRKAVCPECPLPPYLTFPANGMLPVGYRRRATTTNPLWTYYFSSHATCPPESLLYAYHKGLRLDSGQPVYLRVSVTDPKGRPPATANLGTYWQWDRDSVAAASMFLYPNSRYSVQGPNGEDIQAVSVGSFLNGNAAWATYISAANNRVATVLGLKNGIPKSEQSDPTIGETFATDVNDLYAGGTVDGHDHSFRQSNRVIYNHPLNSDPTGYEFDCTVRGVFAQMRFMDGIAGRPTQRCVMGWNVYDK